MLRILNVCLLDAPSKPLNIRRLGHSHIEWDPPFDCIVRGYLVDVKLAGEVNVT